MPLKIKRADGNEPLPPPIMSENTPVLELPPDDEQQDISPNDNGAASFLASMRALFAEARAELEPGDVLDDGPDEIVSDSTEGA